MKKLVAYLTAASLTLSSLSLPIFAEDTAETDNPPELTLEERIAEGISVYEQELAYQYTVPLAPIEETLALWDEYIEYFNNRYYGGLSADAAMKELLEIARSSDSFEGKTTEETTYTTTQSTEDLSVDNPKQINKKYIAQEFHDAVKAVMPENEYQRLVEDPDSYTLYYLDGNLIVAAKIVHGVSIAYDVLNLVSTGIVAVQNMDISGILQELDIAIMGIYQPSGADAIKRLYNLFFLVNERNRELLQIEQEMTEMGLWNVIPEEIQIPDTSESHFDYSPESVNSILGGADGVSDEDLRAWYNALPKLIHDLGSGDDLYRIVESDEPVFAIISESGKGESGDDTLLLDYEVTRDHLQFLRLSGDLYINDPTNEVYLLITGYFSDANKRVETIRFRNGDEMKYADVCDIANSQRGTEKDDVIIGYPETNHIWGNGGNDTLYGNKNVDYLLGGGGDDILTLDDSCLGKLFGVGGNNFAYGMDGNDTVILDNGNDFIWGGKGDDIIRSGAGNDIIYYELGDGNDTVDDSRGESTLPYEGQDVLYLSEGILPEEVSVTLSPNTKIFYLHINKTGDIITLPGNLISGFTPVFPIEEIRFADGTLWTRNDLLECARFFYGTEQDDTLECYLDSNAEFYGNDGNDTMIGKDGNDSFYGGKGDDYLRGGNGDDTFYYELGDGNDTIDMGNGKSSYPQNGYNVLCLGEGILPEDIVIERSYNNYSYTLWLTKTNESITMTGNVISGITNYFPIKEIRFADGTIWKRTDLEANYVKWIRGTDGNDTVRDSTDNDTVYCGKGNDWIDGGEGDDLYIYETGDGRDSICDSSIWGNGHNTLRFGEGITAEDLYIETVKVRSEKFSRLYVRDRASFVELRGVADILLADGTMMTVSEAAELLKPAAELTSELTGDLSCDGALTGDDVRLFLEHLTGESTLRYWETADLNADGVLNALDLTVLKRLICAAAS